VTDHDWGDDEDGGVGADQTSVVPERSVHSPLDTLVKFQILVSRTKALEKVQG
jgi:hypothetical protein